MGHMDHEVDYENFDIIQRIDGHEPPVNLDEREVSGVDPIKALSIIGCLLNVQEEAD